MWKTFEYNGEQRVAFIPEIGPAYQIVPKSGFRAFKPEKMENQASADNLFDMIMEDVLEQYPELENAQQKNL
jgi:hypothetical protein